MKNAKRVLAVLLAALMVCTLVGCGNKSKNTPLVVGYSNFSEKFSPFFSESAYDQDVQGMTQVGLLTSDRTGAIIYKGIDGETVAYNGTDYTYHGIANLTVTENADGTVTYDFVLRDDVKFSDGEKLTADDVIFNMYVLSDPTYDGSSTFFALPIVGMNEYRAGMEILYNLLLAAGENNTDFTLWDEATQKEFWETGLPAAGAKFAQSIVDYVLLNYGEAYGATDVASSAALWGFELAAGATAEDFWAAIYEAYGHDVVTASATEAAESEIYSMFDPKYAVGVTTGDSVDYISGIEKVSDTEVKVTLTEIDATAIYQLGVSVAPLHYYGNAAEFDYNAHKFGFAKGDLSSVKAVTTKPVGAGPYKFVKYENGVVYFEANSNYYLGAPKITNVQFKEGTDDDKLNGVITGTLDIADPTFSTNNIDAIKAANSNGELTGNKVATSTVDNLGYGYVGICADLVNVGGIENRGNTASRNLRKAIATVLAVYRDVSVDSYYGDRASVINYPISNTSWAAPRSTDADYKVAFSTDVNGNPIYTSEMTAEEKYAAAKTAALGYFEAAGYTVKDGKVTAAPAGAAMSWEAWIPADGTGDHPTFMVFTEAAKAFEEIGIEFKVKDLANSSDLWDGLDADQVAIWAAAWGSTVDPDMYQIYYSDIANGGANAGGSNYEYDIADLELDNLILAGRKSLDQSYRKAIYKQCLDIVVDWAVEVPVYQRQNAVIFSSERVNMDTMTPDITTFYGWMSEIENIELK